MPFMVHPASLPTEELLANCLVRTQRRSGPGGQNRNKVETGVVVVYTPSNIRSEATEQRSQANNKEIALFRMRLALAVQIRSPITAPSLLWRNRRSGTRISVSKEHEDYPSVLAELLDGLAHFEYDFALAAEHFGVTASQMIGLLRDHPPALKLINQQREGKGLLKLK
jgi:RF-1 domain